MLVKMVFPPLTFSQFSLMCLLLSYWSIHLVHSSKDVSGLWIVAWYSILLRSLGIHDLWIVNHCSWLFHTKHQICKWYFSIWSFYLGVMYLIEWFCLHPLDPLSYGDRHFSYNIHPPLYEWPRYKHDNHQLRWLFGHEPKYFAFITRPYIFLWVHLHYRPIVSNI